MKRHILPFIFLLFTIGLIIFSSYNLPAAKQGLTLWATSVVPSLFPFFIATELLSKTNIAHTLGKFLNFFMKPLFNVRGEGGFAFIMGVISGYPTGAKIASDFRENNILSKEECERLLSFTNNSGPLFILGTVGISMYGSTQIGLLLFCTHLLASLTVGFIFRFWKKDKKNSPIALPPSINTNIKGKKTLSLSNLGSAISESISSATTSIMMIGGFVVLFSVIISIFNTSGFIDLLTFMFVPCFEFLHIPTSFITPLLTGILEITNGISLISNVHIKAISMNIILTAFLLGTGGISVFLQVLSITSKTDLSIKPYVIGKILHGAIAAFYTFIVIHTFPIFNLNF